MKKTALTFGLFSLVMVATSFATPVVKNSKISIDISADSDGTAGTKTGRRKGDDVIGKVAELNKSNALSSFNAESQSTRNTVKID